MKEAAGVESSAAARRILTDARLWGQDLTTLGALGTEALSAYEAIERRGIRAALGDRLAAADG
jgi:hypothetical protein